MGRRKLIEFPDAQLEAIARIIGESGAAHKAVAEMAARRARGEDAVCYHDASAGMFIVGPRITTATPDDL